MIDKEDGRIDFTKTAVELERRLRAFTPWPGLFTTFEGKLFKVHEAAAMLSVGAPGTLLKSGADGIEVACAEGALLMKKVQPEGKRVMTAAEFLSGRKLEAGSRPFGAQGL